MKKHTLSRWLKSFYRFLISGLSSRRSHGAFLSTGFSSLGNFALSVAIARNGTVNEVAQFAIGFAGFVAVTGLTRAMVGEPSAVRLLEQENLRLGGRQASLYGLFYAVITILLGILMGQPYLIAVGIFGHSIALFDYSKFVSIVFGLPRIAAVQEFIKTTTVISIIFLPGVGDNPYHLFVSWLIVTSLVGYGGTFIQHIHIRPMWSGKQIPVKESLSYAMDYALGSGTTQITTFTLGAVASPTVNASVRGTGTLFGPVTMIASSIRALILPFLARKLRHDRGLNPATNVSLSLLIATVPLVILVNFIPDAWGIELLGETWHLTKDILPILSVEVITTMLTSIPFAGHRTLGAHRRVLILRSWLAALRLVVIISTAIMSSYVLTAYAMAFTSMVGLLCWWVSYNFLMKGTIPER